MYRADEAIPNGQMWPYPGTGYGQDCSEVGARTRRYVEVHRTCTRTRRSYLDRGPGTSLGETGAVAPDPIQAPERAPRAEHGTPAPPGSVLTAPAVRRGGRLRLMTGPAHLMDGSTDVPLVPFLRRRKWHSPPRPAQPWIGADFTGFKGCGGAFFKISLQKKWHTPPGLCFRGFWASRRGFVPLVPLFLNLLLHAHAPAHASSDVEKKWHKWHTALKRAVCLEIPRKTPVPLLRTEVAQAFR